MSIKTTYKKLLSVLLAVALLITCLAVPMTVSAETEDETADELTVWDGTLAEGYASGTGSESDPFIIKTPQQFALAINNFGEDGAYFKLANDIYLNDVSSAAWYEETDADGNAISHNAWFESTDANSKYGYYTLDGESTACFTGTLDGDGHAVYGLWYSVNSTEPFAGLIPTAGEAVIKNLAVKNSYVAANSGTYNVAAFVGASARGYGGTLTIENCFVNSDVILEMGTNGGAIGGFVGYATTGCTTVIKNCYNIMPDDNYVFSGEQTWKINGLIGQTWSSAFSLTNCYSIHQPYNSSNSASRISTLSDAYNNIYSTATAANLDAGTYTTVTAESMIGTTARTAMPNLGSAFCTTDSYPALKVFAGLDSKVWGGFCETPSEGEGSENAPWLIKKAEHLAYAVYNQGNVSDDSAYEYFKLSNDIYLNDMTVFVDRTDSVTVTSGGETVDPTAAGFRSWYYGSNYKKFVGSLDGDGHAVHGLYYNNPFTSCSIDATTTIEASDTVTTAEEALAVMQETYPGLFTRTSWSNPMAGYGLLPGAYNVAITNLAIKDTYMLTNTNYGAGCFIGTYGSSGTKITVDSCYADESVYHQGYDVAAVFGGGGGGNFAVTISNTYSLATLHAGSYVTVKENTTDGVVTGWTYEQKNAYYYTYISDIWLAGTDDVMINCYDGRGYGAARGGVKTNCYATAAEGIAAAYRMPNLNADGAYVITDGHPTLLAFTGLEESNWDNYVTDSFAGGTGEESSPYLVSNAAQLALMVGSLGGGSYYKLTNDIYVNDPDWVDWSTGKIADGCVVAGWYAGTANDARSYVGNSATGVFTGHIDGDGYAVYGLYTMPYDGVGDRVNSAYNVVTGLLPIIKDTTVMNLVIDNAYLCSGRFAGAIAAFSSGTCSFENLAIADNVTAVVRNSGKANGYIYNEKIANYESNGLAGIIAYASATMNIKNCAFSGTLGGGATHIAGLVATHYNTTLSITDSYSIGVQPVYSSSGKWAHGPNRNITVENVYSDVAPEYWNTEYGTVTGEVSVIETATGPNALDAGAMEALDGAVWYAVKAEGKAPMLRIRGTVIGDVDENGVGMENTDVTALRIVLIKNLSPNNGDYNRSSVTDICDLVAMMK